jgi:hypothetical protein
VVLSVLSLSELHERESHEQAQATRARSVGKRQGAIGAGAEAVASNGSCAILDSHMRRAGFPLRATTECPSAAGPIVYRRREEHE